MRTPFSPAQPIPWPEYPRPQMTRPRWQNLNGVWEYAILPAEKAGVSRYEGEILVPFPVESELSGVKRPLLPDQRLWYRRRFRVDPSLGFAPSDRLLLHFGAVDYQCEVFVNGKWVGAHTGGYLPFTIDITEALVDGDNELVVAVYDPTDAGLQERGKQVLKPHTIWYTAASGIWQTVWLEVVPAIHIRSLKLTPDPDTSTLSIEVRIEGDARGLRVGAEVIEDGNVVSRGDAPAGEKLILRLREARRWSPSDPYLYDLKVRLMDGDQAVDEVGSYFGMRKFGLKDGRFTVNDEPTFLFGPLDQGYWPDGLYTPPSEEAMRFDLEYVRRIGCNCIRKHVKVEPARWYALCDRLGLIVWQDMPNGGSIWESLLAALALWLKRKVSDERRLRRFGREGEANRARFRAELAEMVNTLYNAPCIAVWVPFNEGWGQFHSRQIAAWLKEMDPTRLVDAASGWFDQGGGDFQSRHIYSPRLRRDPPDGRAFALTEFGGYSLRVPGHMWDEKRWFGYKHFESPEALTEAYIRLLDEQVRPLISQGLTAAIYTQLTDVEIETNGYLTYDRRVEKMDAATLQRVHARLYQAFRGNIVP